MNTYRKAQEVQRYRSNLIENLIKEARELEQLACVVPFNVNALRDSMSSWVDARIITADQRSAETDKYEVISTARIQLGSRSEASPMWTWYALEPATCPLELFIKAASINLIGRLRSRYEEMLELEYTEMLKQEQQRQLATNTVIRSSETKV